jgi:DnaJ-class molecular chaperone
MTTAEAEDLWCEACGIMDSLRVAFPCTECDGTGDRNPENYPYPDICEECWGRGFSIPDEDDE